MAVRAGVTVAAPIFKIPAALLVRVLAPANVVAIVRVPLLVVVPLIVILGIAIAFAPLIVFAVPEKV